MNRANADQLLDSLMRVPCVVFVCGRPAYPPAGPAAEVAHRQRGNGAE